MRNLSVGALLAAAAALVLSGCATSKQHATSAGCDDCETRWVAVKDSSTLTVASTSPHLRSVVSPIGDAPGERDLAHAQTWQWERHHFCGVSGTPSSVATSR